MGYLHIKTDQDNMVVPVDATVLEGVLFATPQTIDFGILTGDSSHKVKSESPTDLWVFNSGLSPVQVVDIVQTDIDNALKIDAIGGSGSSNDYDCCYESLLYICNIFLFNISIFMLYVCKHFLITYVF